DYEYTVASHAALSARSRGICTAEDSGDSTLLLVRPAGIVGEPLDLHCSARGRRSVSVRLFDQHDYCAASHAWSMAFQPDTPADAAHCPFRNCRSSDHGDGVYRGNFLLARRAVWGAPRSQHSLLEVAAGF